MGLFNGILRVVTSPVEIAARTIDGFCNINPNDDLIGLDIATMGATRVIRKGFLATAKTTKKIMEEFDE